MKQFVQKVDRRSPAEMIRFLRSHPRYHTMNSWNNSTSYAHNVKLTHLGLDRDRLSKAFDFLDVDGAMAHVNAVLTAFDVRHNYKWQAGFNGRSSGYIVLYAGEVVMDTPFSARCDECGNLTFHKSEVPCPRCEHGVLMPTKMAVPNPRISTVMGGVDQDEDFVEWSTAGLKARVELVCEFDEMVQLAVRTFIADLELYDISERTVMVPVTRRVLVPRTGGGR